MLTASIPTLLPFTAALPSFRTLLPRKKTAEVDVTSDWSDPARPGWLHCFTSGSWLPTQLITYPVAQVCAASQSVEGISRSSFRTNSPFPPPQIGCNSQHVSAELRSEDIDRTSSQLPHKKKNTDPRHHTQAPSTQPPTPAPSTRSKKAPAASVSRL